MCLFVVEKWLLVNLRLDSTPFIKIKNLGSTCQLYYVYNACYGLVSFKKDI